MSSIIRKVYKISNIPSDFESVEGFKTNLLNYLRREVFESSIAYRVYEIELENFKSAYTTSEFKKVVEHMPVIAEGEVSFELSLPKGEKSVDIFAKDLCSAEKIVALPNYYIMTLFEGESIKFKARTRKNFYKDNPKYSYVSTVHFDENSSELVVNYKHELVAQVWNQINESLHSRLRENYNLILETINRLK